MCARSTTSLFHNKPKDGTDINFETNLNQTFFDWNKPISNDEVFTSFINQFDGNSLYWNAEVSIEMNKFCGVMGI